MGLFKRVIVEITRRPLRATTLALIIFTMSIMSMIGVFLKDVVNAHYQEFVKIDGYSIYVENMDVQAIPDEIRDKILALEHIVGYNNSHNLEYNCKPLNFKNVPYKSKGVYSQIGTSEDIILYGNINTSLYHTFRNGYMVLKEGEYPDVDNKGAIIDSLLADSNGLSIGSEIELYDEVNDKKVSFNIIGIYETIEAPEIKVESNMGTYYTISPSSYIFCDYYSYYEISGDTNKILSLLFYVDEYENIEDTFSKVEGIASAENGYSVVDCLKNSLSSYGAVIVTLKNISSNIISLTFIISLIILFLMTLLWMRDHYYEAGIYIALGTEKIKIMMYFMLEILVIAIIALGVSLVIGRGIVITYGQQLVDQATALTYKGITMTDIEAKAMENAFSIKSLIYANVIYLAIVLITTLFSSSIIINYNPRKLFAQR